MPSKPTFVGKFRRGTLYTVSFPTLPSLKVPPTYVDIVQKQYKHDVMTLEYKSLSHKWAKLLKTGVPVKFTWTQGSRKKTWYGYVSSVQKMSSAGAILPMKVRCIGASFVLKKRSNKVYKNKTIPEIAAKIAKANGLKFVGENHSRRFDQLSISGHSYWEWLHEQAKRIGYAMYVDGTSLHFRPIDKLLDTAAADTPLFQLWDVQIPTNSHRLDRTLDSLTVISGENIEDEHAPRSNKHVGGINPRTGKPIQSKKSPDKTGRALRSKVSATLFDEHRSDQVVHSGVSAKEAAEGASHMARFNLPAKTQGQGDPRVHPYQLIYIEGAGVSSNGYWVVREAHHKFKYGGQYLLSMTVATDGTEENAKSAKRRSDRSVVGVVNLNQILAGVSSFNTPQSLGKLSSGLGSLGVASTEDTRLSVKQPFLTNVANQGFTRTPSLWTTTKPSDSNVTRAGKCGCNC